MNKREKIFDGLLVLQCQNGSKKAFSLLVKRWHNKLCKQAFFYTKDIDLSKDIAQDSWNVIIRRIASLKEPNSFGSWALTIVNRKAIDWLRKHKKNEKKLHTYYENSQINHDTEINNNLIEDGDNNITDDTAKTVLNVIKKLPKNQQIILTLFYVEEYSILEISSILSISKGTVKSRLFYAREKLKSHLNLPKGKTK